MKEDDPTNRTGEQRQENPNSESPLKESAAKSRPAARPAWYQRLLFRRATLFAIPAFAAGGLFAAHALSAEGGHGCRHRHANVSDAELTERLNRRVDFALNRLGANDDQKAAIRTRLEALEPELLKARADHKQIKKQLREEFGKQKVSAQEVEKLRKQMLELGNRITSSLTDALVDMSDVLTVEQRQKIIEHLSHRW